MKSDEAILLAIDDLSVPLVREGENVVTFHPGGAFNVHRIPEWAYLELLSNNPIVETATQTSDYFRIRVGYKDPKLAGTLISRIGELEKQVEIERVSAFPRNSKYALIADICYAKDNSNSLLYVFQDVDVDILPAYNCCNIMILK